MVLCRFIPTRGNSCAFNYGGRHHGRYRDSAGDRHRSIAFEDTKPAGVSRQNRRVEIHQTLILRH